jgi:lambda repressor-like predicted transcriptional regulator
MPAHPVRRELLEAGRTMADLARATGYSPAVMQRVLGGHARPWPKLRARVARELGKPEKVLFPEWTFRASDWRPRR